MTATDVTITPGADWQAVEADYGDVRYETAEGIAKITICRPEVRNAFRPKTLFELMDAFERARNDRDIGVIIFTGEGSQAFCSGGDQRVRGDDGYVGDDGIGRLNVLDLQVQIRRLPKPVVAMVAGYAIGGGHVLHVVGFPDDPSVGGPRPGEAGGVGRGRRRAGGQVLAAGGGRHAGHVDEVLDREPRPDGAARISWGDEGCDGRTLGGQR